MLNSKFNCTGWCFLLLVSSLENFHCWNFKIARQILECCWHITYYEDLFYFLSSLRTEWSEALAIPLKPLNFMSFSVNITKITKCVSLFSSSVFTEQAKHGCHTEAPLVSLVEIFIFLHFPLSLARLTHLSPFAQEKKNQFHRLSFDFFLLSV